MSYTPERKSIKTHQVPDWFHDAKLGIFIHWGLYSVPAFAVTDKDIIETMEGELEEVFKNNPYVSWYLNTLRVPGSPTQKYHFETYGEDFSYDDFVPIFNEEIKKWNPKEWAKLFKRAGGKYVVLTTKHHDGFLLWPSKYQNPKKKNYCASRDILGELSEAVRKEGLKMGFYYSSRIDWSFNPEPMTDPKSYLKNGPRTPEYIEYVNNHWYELIDHYESLILWNDLGHVPTNVYEIFAYFYNKFPEGVVNDRWGIARQKGDTHPTVRHSDFLTPEYEQYNEIKPKKWETCRGIGKSFGYNKFENEKDYLKPDELIRLFVDVVSKNGNLLINVGPMADGTIPKLQEECILGLGKWLEVNGEAIYGTRPWVRAEGETLDKIDVRFTTKETSLYMILLDTPKSNVILIKSLNVDSNATILLLSYRNELEWKQEGNDLKITLPKNLAISPAHSFKITPKPNLN